MIYKVWYHGMIMYTSTDFIECVDKCKSNQWDFVELLGRVVYPYTPKKKKDKEDATR